MAQGVSEVLTFAVGVAISPVPIIAVILMLFSQRARVNGPVFLLGWVLALAVVSGVVYVASDQSGAAADSTVSDSISWGKILLGTLLLLLAVRSWPDRPAPGANPEMPKWMAGLGDLPPGKALGLGLLLAGVNPKNLILTLGAAAGLAQLGVSTEAAAQLAGVFVTWEPHIAGPVSTTSSAGSAPSRARRAQGLAGSAQRRRDGSAPLRPRRQPGRQGHSGVSEDLLAMVGLRHLRARRVDWIGSPGRTPGSPARSDRRSAWRSR